MRSRPRAGRSGPGAASLDAIGLRRGTDRSSRHHDFLRIRDFLRLPEFLRLHESFFAPLRDRALRILETGLREGQSLQTRAGFFPRAQDGGHQDKAGPGLSFRRPFR